jgi:hypothetical protein
MDADTIPLPQMPTTRKTCTTMARVSRFLRARKRERKISKETAVNAMSSLESTRRLVSCRQPIASDHRCVER